VQTFELDRNGRRLRLAPDYLGPDEAPEHVYVLSAGEGHVCLTLPELRWLVIAVGPVAIAELERAGASS